MKSCFLLTCATALFSVAIVGAQPASLPHLEKRGGATQLMVDGRPFLMLGGEVTNSASSSPEYMAQYWPKMAAAGLNTVLAAVTWELTEPEPGVFDFSLVDGMIRDARRYNQHLILLWFGSWKNGVSTYPPLWVKRDAAKYPLFTAENGVHTTNLSVFYEVNWKADAHAFAALMRHIKEVDGEGHTVVMIQVENEVGCGGGTRDFSPAAKTAYDGAAPKALLDYMAKNRERLVPEFRKQWESTGGKTSGTWREVFGGEPIANEIFMSWYYSQYVDQVVKAGKAEYPIPMFINVDLGEKIGGYSAGGALPIQLNVWQQGAPSLDIIGPDIYLPNFADWCALYHRSGNPLWIPETSTNPGNAFFAIGAHSGMGISPFGIERSADAGTPFAKAYAVLGQLAPAILEAQARGSIGAVLVTRDGAPQKISLGNYTLEFKMSQGRRPPAAAPAVAAPNAPPPSGYAMVISTGPEDYILAGNMVQVTFSVNSPGPSTAAVGALEEGDYVDGRWVPGRRLNGDDIIMNYDAINQAIKNDSGQGFRLTGDGPRIVRLKLYRY